MKPHKKVKALTGTDMKVFRPFYGNYNDTLIEVAEECGYYPIQWDAELSAIASKTWK